MRCAALLSLTYLAEEGLERLKFAVEGFEDAGCAIFEAGLSQDLFRLTLRRTQPGLSENAHLSGYLIGQIHNAAERGGPFVRPVVVQHRLGDGRREMPALQYFAREFGVGEIHLRAFVVREAV